jgi:hypothetical protein
MDAYLGDVLAVAFSPDGTKAFTGVCVLDDVHLESRRAALERCTTHVFPLSQALAVR